MIRLLEVTIGACLGAFVVGQVGVTDCAVRKDLPPPFSV
jgi:hypothetical protein